MLVRKYIDNCKEREPIFVRDVKVVDKYKGARDTAFHRLEKENKIKSYKKGIYYKPKKTMFGELGIDTNQLILKKYIKHTNHIEGYLTGPVLWNNWNITTQVPNRMWVVTNRVSRDRELKDLKVKLMKPKTIIDDNNYEFLQLLDVIDQADQIQDIDWDTYIEVLINKLESFSIDQIRYTIELASYYRKFVNSFIGALIEEKFKNSNIYDQLYVQMVNLKTKANAGRKYKLICKNNIHNADEWGFY